MESSCKEKREKMFWGETDFFNEKVTLQIFEIKAASSKQCYRLNRCYLFIDIFVALRSFDEQAKAKKMVEQYPLYLYFFSLLSATIFFYKWFTLRKTALRNLPPSPPRFPIIGNLHQVGPDPYISLRAWAKKYGPLMLLKFGSVPVVVVSSAEAAREILKTHDLVFADRPFISVANRLTYNGRDVAFARYSEYWRQVKSICVTQLLSSRRVQSFHDVREEEVALLIRNIEHPPSKIVNLSDLLAELTQNVVSRVALGRKYGSGENGNSSYKILLEEIMELLGYSRSMRDYFPLLGFVLCSNF
nr:PREDICTED: psoralen synthase-like [Daucus carota subsp. sativus]